VAKTVVAVGDQHVGDDAYRITHRAIGLHDAPFVTLRYESEFIDFAEWE
jgi:hypothetical protein